MFSEGKERVCWERIGKSFFNKRKIVNCFQKEAPSKMFDKVLSCSSKFFQNLKNIIMRFTFGKGMGIQSACLTKRPFPPVISSQETN